eukprot:16366-Eustigmatos_ZCMA.PRE.1
MGDSHESDGGDADPVFDMGMGTFCLALLFGILARAWIAKIIKLPYTVIVSTTTTEICATMSA